MGSGGHLLRTIPVGVCLFAMGCGSVSTTGEGNNQVDTVCEAGFLEECDEQTAADSLTWSDVSCQWEGRNVVVRATVQSDFNARLRVGLIPRYYIEKGGKHGTSFGSERYRTIDPGSQTTFRINAGHPKGVPSGTTIEKCNPKVQDVELSD